MNILNSQFLMWNKMSSSSSSNSSSSGHEFLDVDTKTLPRIGAEI